MKHKLRRVLAVTAALSLTMMFSLTAHAGGWPEYPVREDQEVILRAPDIPADDTAETYTPPQQDTSTQTPSGSKTEEAKPLTPEGNMTLVDDVESKTEEDKQFITVVTKNGNKRTSLDFQIYVFQNLLFPIVVGKAQVFNFDNRVHISLAKK